MAFLPLEVILVFSLGPAAGLAIGDIKSLISEGELYS